MNDDSIRFIRRRHDPAEQAALRANFNKVILLSKTEATFGGYTVTLNPFTGALTCTCQEPDQPDCRHVAAVRVQALKRIKR